MTQILTFEYFFYFHQRVLAGLINGIGLVQCSLPVFDPKCSLGQKVTGGRLVEPAWLIGHPVQVFDGIFQIRVNQVEHLLLRCRIEFSFLIDILRGSRGRVEPDPVIYSEKTEIRLRTETLCFRNGQPDIVGLFHLFTSINDLIAAADNGIHGFP